MLRIVILAVWTFLVSDLFGQETLLKSVQPFHALKADGPMDIRLVKGNDYSVKVETKGFPSGKVDFEVSGSVLRIELEGSVIRNSSKVDIWVTYKDLDKIEATGAANIFGTAILSSKFLDLNASTAATIELESETDQLTIESQTAGQVIVSGKTRRLALECATSANVDAYRLISDEVKAEIRTAASGKVYVLKQIEAQVSTAGSLRYRGTPEKSNLQTATGGGIRKVD